MNVAFDLTAKVIVFLDGWNAARQYEGMIVHIGQVDENVFEYGVLLDDGRYYECLDTRFLRLVP